MQHTFMRRYGRLAAIAALFLGAGITACQDFLEAENPGAIESQDLNKPEYVNLIANGVVGEFQFANAHATWWNALFTDEIYNRNTPAEEILMDKRDVRVENGTYSFFFYGNIHRARFLADDAVKRLKIILGDSASRDLRVARSLAYGGMTYVYIAEALCESPIDLSAPLSPDTIFARGIVRFEEAIAVANAAKAVTGATAGVIAAADSLRNFALVGAARAYLNMNNKAKAIELASQVPATFDFRAFYSENSTREFNYTATRIGTVNGGNVGTMLNTPFDTIGRQVIVRPGLPDSLAPYDPTKGDPRVPRRGGAPGVTNAIPFAPSAYSVYVGRNGENGTAADSALRRAGAPFSRANSVRIASGLEARYIVAEAQGPTAATLEFVNERRDAGFRAPVTLSGDALMEELREQRARDFYLDNHRIGDLRRYKKYYGVDKFQKGTYPTIPSDSYIDVSCWPLPISEINDNPNIPKPYTSPGH